MRVCISCRQTFDRANLLKITKDYERGVTFNNGFGRSAYICKSKNCYTDSKLKKKLQKALKTTCDEKLFIFIKRKLKTTIDYPNERI